MRPRAVDWALFALIAFELISGFGSFLVGRPEGRWLFVLHGMVGLAIPVLLVWKFRRVARRVTEPRRWQPATIVSVLTAVAVLFTVGTGVYWTIVQRPVDYPNGMILHTGGAIALAVLYLWHMVLRFKPLQRRDLQDRRTALRFLAALLGGGAFWALQDGSNRALATPGADRRFTGSRLAAPYASNTFPVTVWMFDNPAPVDVAQWRLHLTGAVETPLAWTLDELLALPQSTVDATLDCTGGWYTHQPWQGIAIHHLLDQTALLPQAAFVSVRAVTGYRWSLPLAEARQALLATHVAGAPLRHGHGAPLRLVAPGRRGFQWVKWIDTIEVRTRPDPGQWGVIFTSGIGDSGMG